MLDYTTLRTRCLEARVDWLTCTSRDPMAESELQFWGEELTRQDEELGDRKAQWHFQGYKGYQTSSCRYGVRPDGGILILTQEVAHAAAPVLAKLNVAWSRIDYCVTICDPEGKLDPFNDLWAAYPWRDGRVTGHPSIARREDSLGGSTVTLGSRQSAYFVRVYNKTAESKGDYPKVSWRYEVEIKAAAAEGERKRWAGGPLNGILIRGFIGRELHRLQLPVPWTRDQDIERWQAPSRIRDADRSLLWLQEQVSPCVHWLRQQLGDADVLTALGFAPNDAK